MKQALSLFIVGLVLPSLSVAQTEVELPRLISDPYSDEDVDWEAVESNEITAVICAFGIFEPADFEDDLAQFFNVEHVGQYGTVEFDLPATGQRSIQVTYAFDDTRAEIQLKERSTQEDGVYEVGCGFRYWFSEAEEKEMKALFEEIGGFAADLRETWGVDPVHQDVRGSGFYEIAVSEAANDYGCLLRSEIRLDPNGRMFDLWFEEFSQNNLCGRPSIIDRVKE